MILQALNRYYDRLSADPNGEIAPFGFSRQKIAFCVIVNTDGALSGIEDLRIFEGKRAIPASVQVCGDSKPTGAGINPCFLWDNPAYLLGYKPEDPKPERTREAFEAFRRRHLDLELTINDSAFSAVCRFLEQWDPDSALQHPTLVDVGTGFGVFRLSSEPGFLHERETIRNWWLTQIQPPEDESTADTRTGQCLVTGNVTRLARLHEPKIKGVFGAQSSGAAIVSFNLDAFESYGKSQSYNAPVSEQAAFQYCTALNHLLSDRARRIQIGDATVVFWTEQPSDAAEELFGFALGNPPEDPVLVSQLQKMLATIGQGKYPTEFTDPETPFYVLGLSPNAARISVRFWHVSTLGKMVENLRQHYADLEIDGIDGFANRITIPAILGETVPVGRGGYPDMERVSSPLAERVTNAILNGFPFPQALLQQVLNRIRVDGFSDTDRRRNCLDSRKHRAAILKACLLRMSRSSGQIPKGDSIVSTSLDKLHLAPAYHCGRLLAVLAFTQEVAMKSLNSGVVRRYIAAASVSPGLHLGRLQVAAEIGHLHKIGSKKVSSFIRDEIKQISNQIGAVIPLRINPLGQSLFMLGFYQELTHLEKDRASIKHLYRTMRGEWVRSIGEKMIADTLAKMRIDACYEPRPVLASGTHRIPDFIVLGAEERLNTYIEFLGVNGKDADEYNHQWDSKLAEYRMSGITPEGGTRGRLLVIDGRTEQWDEPKLMSVLSEWFCDRFNGSQ